MRFCAVCEFYSLRPICKTCIHNMLKIDNCSRNSKNIIHNKGLSQVDNIYCNYVYASPLSDMLHGYKYFKNKKLSWALGQLLYQTFLQHNLLCNKNKFGDSNNGPDMFIPMPIHKIRLKERGFNQAQLLLNYYCVVNDSIPVYTHIVKRVIYREKQARSLSVEERLYNIEDVFAIKHPDMIRNKHIVIIDDVVTTGASVNELAKLLKLYGARQVDVCALMCSILYKINDNNNGPL